MSVNTDYIAPKRSSTCHFGPLHINAPIVTGGAVSKAYADSAASGALPPCTSSAFAASVTSGPSSTFTISAYYVIQGSLVYLTVKQMTFTGKGNVLSMGNIPLEVLPLSNRTFMIPGFVDGEDQNVPNRLCKLLVSPTGCTFTNSMEEGSDVFTLGTHYCLYLFTVCYNRSILNDE